MLCILGSGAQARSHAQALKFVRPFTEVRELTAQPTEASAFKMFDHKLNTFFILN